MAENTEKPWFAGLTFDDYKGHNAFVFGKTKKGVESFKGAKFRARISNKYIKNHVPKNIQFAPADEKAGTVSGEYALSIKLGAAAKAELERILARMKSLKTNTVTQDIVFFGRQLTPEEIAERKEEQDAIDKARADKKAKREKKLADIVAKRAKRVADRNAANLKLAEKLAASAGKKVV